MGEDLDSGGALVLGDWQFIESIGHHELVIDCRTPSGAPLPPLHVWMTRSELEDYIRAFRVHFPRAFNSPG